MEASYFLSFLRTQPFRYFSYDSSVDIQCGPFVAAQAQNYYFDAVTSSACRRQQNCMDLRWPVRHFVAVVVAAVGKMIE